MKFNFLITALITFALFCAEASSAQKSNNRKDPVTLSGAMNGAISASELAEADMLETSEELHILSFTMFVENSEKIVTEISSSGYLTADMLNKLRDVKDGDKVYFGKIKAKDSTGREVSLKNVELMVTH